jgi:hypothetical protein
MFIQVHEKATGNSMLVRVSAIDIVTIEDRGRMNDPTTVFTIGNERYEVVESYEQILWMVLDGGGNR